MTQTEIDLSFYGGPVTDRHTLAMEILYRDIKKKVDEGEPVYVKFNDYRREGSVGRIIKFEYSSYRRKSPWHNGTEYLNLSLSELVIGWDGRRNKVNPYISEIRYLPDHSGGTVWAWEKPDPKEKPPKIIPYDHLGEEIMEGQFVCFVHRKYGIIDLMFGTVSRTTDKGGVFVKSLKLRDNDPPASEKKAYSADDLVIVNDKLLSRLVMARLAAQ